MRSKERIEAGALRTASAHTAYARPGPRRPRPAAHASPWPRAACVLCVIPYQHCTPTQFTTKKLSHAP